MERVVFNIERDDVAIALRDHAKARGRSIEAELNELVERTFAPAADTSHDSGPSEDWVRELIRITRPGFEEDPFPRVRMAHREVDL